jgi:hypothetical protein
MAFPGCRKLPLLKVAGEAADEMAQKMTIADAIRPIRMLPVIAMPPTQSKLFSSAD